MVTVAGKPSGIAAMAMVIPVIAILRTGSPLSTPAIKTTTHTARQMIARVLPSSPSFFCNGVSGSFISSSMVETLPIWLRSPVATAVTSPTPFVTTVPMYTM